MPHPICSLHSALQFVYSVPVLTVAEELVIIQEGGNFTLTCSSSLPNLPIDWLHLPTFNRQSGPTISVTGASYSDEGDYRCSILEMGELTIASVTVTVDVILSELAPARYDDYSNVEVYFLHAVSVLHPGAYL